MVTGGPDRLRAYTSERNGNMIYTLYDTSEENYKTYRKRELYFSYYTPEHFDELKVEPFGEINLKKVYSGDISNKNNKVDLVLLKDRKNEHSKYFEIKDLKKQHEKTAIGYICVTARGENQYIRVMDDNGILFFLLLIAGAVLIAGLSVAVLSNRGRNTEITETKPTLEYADGKDWDGTLPERYQEEIDYQEGIEIAGYTNLLVTTDHQSIDLINTDKNTVYQQYKIYLEDKELFDSKLIAPGKQVAWNAYEVLESGNYMLNFEISTYDVETQAPCNGLTQSVSLEVRK